MIRSMHIRSLMSAAAVLLLTFVVSCNKFEYGYDENNPGNTNPNESELKFSVNWDKAGVPAGETPESITVLMSRKVNSLHYVWTLDGNGGFMFPELPEQSDQPSPELQADPAVPTVNNGNYYTVAFSDDADFYQISSYEGFASDIAVSMTELYANVPALTNEEFSEDKDMIDFNPYAGFIRQAESPLYLDIIKDVAFMSEPSKVVLRPKNLTRELTFQLKVVAEDGVEIEKITAVLSGVASSLQLISGLMTKANTAKVVFDMENVGKGTVELDRVQVSCDRYNGSARVWGVFAPEDRSYITGPGILQVCVVASVAEDNKVKSRIFHAGLNLKSVLESKEHNLMIHSDDKTGYTMKEQSLIRPIVVSAPLVVTKNQIKAAETEGLVNWRDNDAEIIPDEIPDIY